MAGTLLVSLDFELFWGMLEVCPLEKYRENVLGGRKAIPELLSLFQKYNIHATWAAVGFLFGANAAALESFLPEKRPGYADPRLDPYEVLKNISEEDEKCFFCPELVEKIAGVPGQEIGSHTFCHYYCRAKGQTVSEFEKDLAAAQRIAGGGLKSLVLPRNQTEPAYTQALGKLGFTSFRGEENDWIHRHIHFRPLLRALRLVDVYLPITGPGGYRPKKEDGVWNLTGSRMYKPIFPALRFLEGLKMHRIKSQMRHAARRKLYFHLWWHPHNIGVDTQAHLKQLEEIFRYYDVLRQKYGMESLNMGEAAEQLEKC